MRQADAARGKVAGGQIEVLEYPDCPGAPPLPAWDGWVEVEEAGTVEAAEGRAKNMRSDAAGAAMDKKLAEDVRRSFEAGRDRGREEGRHAERGVQAEALAEEQERHKRQLAALVVKLALAVAARILRREAQMDPLLLTGAVRVALGQLAASSEVRLRVPPAELELWTEAIALLPNLTMKPLVVAGEGMHLGDCTIESKAGTADLGVRAQLGEIERGFFDRIAASAREVFAAQGAEAGEAQP